MGVTCEGIPDPEIGPAELLGGGELYWRGEPSTEDVIMGLVSAGDEGWGSDANWDRELLWLVRESESESLQESFHSPSTFSAKTTSGSGTGSIHA